MEGGWAAAGSVLEARAVVTTAVGARARAVVVVVGCERSKSCCSSH